MERISIFNYEAFYLDFLEGNLNEEDTALLFAFLEKHPELEIDTKDFPSIEESFVKIDAGFIDGLKQVDLTKDIITLKNAEQFMIASLEGQLDAHKESELTSLIDKHPQLASEFAQIQQLKLKLDPSIVFADKASLKQSTRIVLWPYAAAAASILLFFLVYQGFQTSQKQNVGIANTESMSTKKDEKLKNATGDKPRLERHNATLVPSNEDQKIKNISIANFKPKDEVASDHLNTSVAKNEHGVQKMEGNPGEKDLIKPIHEKQNIDVNFTEVMNNELALTNEKSVSTDNTDADQKTAPVQPKMRNPIKPLTTKISELVNRDIDLQTAQSTIGKRKGFYLKIGKLEIERK